MKKTQKVVLQSFREAEAVSRKGRLLYNEQGKRISQTLTSVHDSGDLAFEGGSVVSRPQ